MMLNNGQKQEEERHPAQKRCNLSPKVKEENRGSPSTGPIKFARNVIVKMELALVMVELTVVSLASFPALFVCWSLN